MATDIEHDQIGENVASRLSPRELAVLALIVQARRNRDIAAELGTSEQVIKNYVHSIFNITGMSTRLELAVYTLAHPELHSAANRALRVTGKRSA
jgi:DNA-binding NarL/FixJ family response regulator